MSISRDESWNETLAVLNRREKNRKRAQEYRDRKKKGVKAERRKPGPKASPTIRAAVLEVERTELLKAVDRTNDLLEKILLSLRGRPA